MVTFYHKGGEDSEWAPTGAVSIITTAGQFRAGIARCALGLNPSAGTSETSTWKNRVAFPGPPSSLWTTIRLFQSTLSGIASSNLTNAVVAQFSDANGVVRLRFRNNVASVTPAVIIVEKVTAAGVATQLGSVFNLGFPGTVGAKIDIFCNYNTSGSLQFYYNGTLLFSFSGDVTTDSTTTLSYIEWGCYIRGATQNYSEGITSDTDTRTWGLVTQAPVANGNTHNWDTGSPAAANVNATTTTFLTMDGSTTAGQIDQYTCPANPAGIFGIVCYSIHALAQKGTSGPSKVNLGPRTGGSDFFATNPDVSLGVSFTTVVSDYFTNPNTSNPWQTTEIGNASGFNIGAKSVT